VALALAGVATATAYAASAALFPRVPVSCQQMKNTRTPGYSVGCIKLNRTGYATYINARSVAVVDTRTGRVVFQRNH
jgi:D-alanyl-D-alanine carboxypeptidase